MYNIDNLDRIRLIQIKIIYILDICDIEFIIRERLRILHSIIKNILNRVT
jgi:hypothetical protein